MATLDLERVSRLFLRRGERVVVVLPSGEHVVLVPLPEYEKLVQGSSRPAAGEAPRERRGKSGRGSEPGSANPTAKPRGDLEVVDPPQGGLKDDDQYFPEPLEG